MHEIKKKTNRTFYIFWLTMLFLCSLATIIILYTLFPNFSLSFIQIKKNIESLQSRSNDNTTTIIRSPSQNNVLREDIVNDNINTNVTISENQQTYNNTRDNSPLYSVDNAGGIEDRSAQIEKEGQFSNSVLATATPLENKAMSTTQEKEETNNFFVNRKLLKGPRFLSKDGKKFFAGTLEIIKNYPYDFQNLADYSNIESNFVSDSFSVKIFIDIGWTNLLPFSDISNLSSKTDKAPYEAPLIEIPYIEILDIRVERLNEEIEKKDKMLEDLNTFIRKYTNQLISSKDIPANIVYDAQKKLATTYVTEGFSKIVLSHN